MMVVHAGAEDIQPLRGYPAPESLYRRDSGRSLERAF